MLLCPLCKKTFKTSKCLNLHTLSHTKEKPHKCLKCPSAFGQLSALTRHVRVVHDGIKQIPKRNSHCSMCSYKCYNNTILRNHMRKHSAEQPLSCDIPSCGFKTKYERTLLLHAFHVHSDERPFNCPTEECSYKAKRREHLRAHLKVHSVEKPFPCTLPGCDFVAKFKFYLKIHNSRVHCNGKLYRCSNCDFKTEIRSSLSRHLLKHMNIKPFQCQFSNCAFASHQREDLQRHCDRKHRKQDVICTEPACNFRCATISLLKMHLKRHENPVLKCPSETCNYSTKFKHNLAKHSSRHHANLYSATGGAPIISDYVIPRAAGLMNTLRCSFTDCRYETKFQHHYDRHKITHNKEAKRKHVCSFCCSRFRDLGRLTEHIHSHLGEKPYRCSHCNYTTGDIFRLRTHARKSHHIYVIPRGKEDELRKCLACGRSCLSYSEFVLHSMTHLEAVVVLQRLHIDII